MAGKTPFNIIIAVFLLFLFTSISPVYAKGRATLAILPFDAYSETDIGYIRSGVLTMLYSRLYWKDRIDLINKDDIQDRMAGVRHLPENERIMKMGDSGWTDYVLTGSITEYANAFSLDVKIYDLKKQSFLTFYEQTREIDQVIPKIDIISAKINKKAFDRTTTTFERLKKEEIISEEELKRIHPEQMLPYHQKMNRDKAGKKPWWKIW